MVTSVIAKPGYYGGRKFVKYNDETRMFYVGNTASTAVSESAAGICVHGVLQGEVKRIAYQLECMGYTEFTPDWSQGVDTYGGIREAGL